MNRLVSIALAGVLCASTPGAIAATYELPPEGGDIVGELQTTRTAHQDTFVTLARRFNVGYEDLVHANPRVDPWLPGEGTEIVIPSRFILPDAPREGLVLNVPEMRLYYYPKPARGEAPVVMTFPVSVGRMDWQTPMGLTHVATKVRHPVWYPPESIRDEHAADGRPPLAKVVPPGPDNPLGAYAMRLGIPGYLIHGTNRPAGVGMRVTHGCIRMFPEDIEGLFPIVPIGTRVRILNQPYKVGWSEQMLFLEVHPPLEEDQDVTHRGMTTITELFVAATAERLPEEVDWDATAQIFARAAGFPEPMLTRPLRTAENREAGGCSDAASPTCRRD